jgi:hypothetical protein
VWYFPSRELIWHSLVITDVTDLIFSCHRWYRRSIPNLSHQEERELELIAAHCRRQAETIVTVRTDKRNRRRGRQQEPSVDIHLLPDESLIVPVEECVVQRLLYRGQYCYFWVPSAVIIPKTCSVAQAVNLVKRHSAKLSRLRRSTVPLVVSRAILHNRLYPQDE